MKKIVLIAATLLMTTGAFAQFSWGVKGGANLANITDGDNSKFKPSMYAGVFAEYKLNNIFGIQTELVYSRQGCFWKDVQLEGADNKAKAWLRLNYINLPVLAKIYIVEGLSIDLGPQFGYMLNDKVRIKLDGASKNFDPEDVFEGYKSKSFDVSVAMGATYTIAEKFDISARYNLGLTKITKDTKSKNSVIQVGVGYRF